MFYKKLDELNDNIVSESNRSLIKSNHKWIDLAARISQLEERGVIESAEKMEPLNKNEPQPLLTFSFMDWLQSHDFSEYQLIEFGSGNSTLYFSKLFQEVCSYENNIEWFHKLKDMLPNNVKYELVNDWNTLPACIVKEKNVLLVDVAGNRYKIVKNLIDVNYNGLLILDNSDTFPNTVKLLLENGYKEITFYGSKLTQPYDSCTSIFFKNMEILPRRNFNAKLPTVRKSLGNLYDKP